MPYIIALALLLPDHAPELARRPEVIAGPKLHPLWHTPRCPLLGLVSCLAMGLGAAVLLAAAMRRGWNARQDDQSSPRCPWSTRAPARLLRHPRRRPGGGGEAAPAGRR
jgi:Ni/Fe-hydrogenase subunit HybB-like protein